MSFWVSKNPGVQPWDDLPSASNLVLLAVNESLPLDFISFHVVTQCTDPSTCNPLNVRLFGSGFVCDACWVSWP